jgi:hypothetical protein
MVGQQPGCGPARYACSRSILTVTVVAVGMLPEVRTFTDLDRKPSARQAPCQSSPMGAEVQTVQVTGPDPVAKPVLRPRRK